MIEIWKAIPGYDNYQVSNLGNVKSLRFGREKILKAHIDSNGYCRLPLYKDKKIKLYRVHQLVAMAFLKHKPDGTLKIVVDHVNDNKTDNRLENLQLTTNRYNAYKTQGNYSSKYKGVCWAKNQNKWIVSIRINGKSKHLGYFIDEYEAHLEYQKALKEITKGK